ncbi:5'-3' exonuclease H3TH domain-containing protein [Deinococcus sp. S9]|uniref:5'-3' exonuclease n=1 Tax=Deinococcus sp. S9 TaxID=2545754 RepID=UPI001F11910F|nr:5'-3' exonuclease H3TH domain-containing protein [Deinococcus sp. S9]
MIDVSNIAARSYHSVAKEGPAVLPLARHRLKQMLRTLLREAEPLRLLGALDCGRSFRHDLYPDYKGHRGEKPDELRALLEEAPELLKREFGVELFQSPGFEADDVMATIADANLAAGWRTLLCTGDRDLLATAFDGGGGAGTFILHYDRGTYFSLGPEQVEQKMGVPPHRVALLKSVQGDSSDGIVGCPGLGPIAAKRLANEYPSVRKLFQNLDRLQSSDRKKLEAAGLEYMLLQEQLTTLRFDAPLVAV